MEPYRRIKTKKKRVSLMKAKFNFEQYFTHLCSVNQSKALVKISSQLNKNTETALHAFAELGGIAQIKQWLEANISNNDKAMCKSWLDILRHKHFPFDYDIVKALKLKAFIRNIGNSIYPDLAAITTDIEQIWAEKSKEYIINTRDRKVKLSFADKHGKQLSTQIVYKRTQPSSHISSIMRHSNNVITLTTEDINTELDDFLPLSTFENDDFELDTDTFAYNTIDSKTEHNLSSDSDDDFALTFNSSRANGTAVNNSNNGTALNNSNNGNSTIAKENTANVIINGNAITRNSRKRKLKSSKDGPNHTTTNGIQPPASKRMRRHSTETNANTNQNTIVEMKPIVQWYRPSRLKKGIPKVETTSVAKKTEELRCKNTVELMGSNPSQPLSEPTALPSAKKCQSSDKEATNILLEYPYWSEVSRELTPND